MRLDGDGGEGVTSRCFVHTYSTLLASAIVACVWTADAQAQDAPPPPAEDSVPGDSEVRPPESPPTSEDEASAYAAKQIDAEKDCWEAVEAAKDLDVSSIKDHYKSVAGDRAICTAPLRSVRALLAVSLKWKADNKFPLSDDRYAALQLLPSFTIGIPIYTARMEALKTAMKGAATFGGMSIRYTPASFIYSFNLNLGVATVGDGLDRTVFPDPRVLAMGLGITFLGAFEVAAMNVRLTKNGLWDGTVDSGYYVAFSLDITSLLSNPIVSIVRQN